MNSSFKKDRQYFKFCTYGFLKNLRFFEPFLLLFFIEKGTSFTQIGIIYATREITRNLFEIPAGIAADALGRRRTMLASFTFYILSFLLFYFSLNLSGLLFAMVVYALGDAFRTGTHKAMIFDYLKMKGWQDQKVDYYGHTRSFSQIGSALSALVAALFVFLRGNYSAVFLASILPFLLNFILISTYPRQLDGSVSSIKRGHIFENFKRVFKDFIYSLKDKKVQRSIGNTAIFSAYYKAVKDYIQPVLNNLALGLPVLIALNSKSRSAVVIGVVYFIIYLFSSWAARNSGSFNSRFRNLKKPLNITLLAGLVSGVLAGLFYSWQLTALAVLFYLVVFMIENLRKPIGMAYVANQLDKDILATALSAESQLKSLFAAVFAVILGFSADRYGVGNAILISTALLLFLFPAFRAKA